MLCTCLGHEDAADLRTPLRLGSSDDRLVDAIRAAVLRKPKGHDFVTDRPSPVRRAMSATGG